MRPLIGVTSGELKNQFLPWGPKVYGQAYTYTNAIIHAGGAPIILPLTDDTAVLDEMHDRIDGLLLAGGNDIDPKLYAQEAIELTKMVTPLRDSTEAYLIKRFVKSDKPILAICRGMQIINVVFGGSLHQDIGQNLKSSIDHNSIQVKNYEHLVHPIRIKADSKLGKIMGREIIDTNSIHHQAINKIGKNLKAVAWSEDGIIEGMETNDNRFVVGVQAHPESLESRAETDWRKLFEAFIAACRDN